MSGPKLVELRRMWAESRKQFVSDRCSSRDSEYARFEEEFLELVRRLEELGVDVEIKLSPGKELARRIATMLAENRHDAADKIYEAEIARAETETGRLRTRLRERITELRNRFRRLEQDREAIGQRRDELAAFAKAATPDGLDESERIGVEEEIARALEKLKAPGVVELNLNREAIAQMEEASASVEVSRRLADEVEAETQSAIQAARDRAVSRSVQADIGVARDFKQWRAEFSSTTKAAAEPEEEGVLEKLDEAMSGIALLESSANWSAINRRAAEIRAESDAHRRRVLYESLLIDCGGQLKQRKAFEKWRAEVDCLLDLAAPFASEGMEAMIAELNELRRAGRVDDLSDVQSRFESALETAASRRERRQKREALLETLTALGYEAEEGMGTAFVEAGRLVVRQAEDDDYAIEVVADQELNRVQTTMIRYAESDEMSEQQRRRDEEREESWCADHGKLRRMMADRGWETSFGLQLAPGEHPVKTVVNPECARKAGRQSEATPGQRSRTV